MFYRCEAVIATLDELISQIQAGYKIQKKVKEPLLINIFVTSAGAGQPTAEVNCQVIFCQVLIDFLLRLKSTQTDKNELIECCRNEHKGNSFNAFDTIQFS